MFFHQIFIDVDNITSINDIISNTKIINIFINPVFFILSTEKFSETFRKRKEYLYISESFALN